MKESHSERLAIHTGLESSGVVRENNIEALTGEGAGRVSRRLPGLEHAVSLVSSRCQNPSPTCMAMMARACDYAALHPISSYFRRTPGMDGLPCAAVLGVLTTRATEASTTTTATPWRSDSGSFNSSHPRTTATSGLMYAYVATDERDTLRSR